MFKFGVVEVNFAKGPTSISFTLVFLPYAILGA